jgi:hypothetical protein
MLCQCTARQTDTAQQRSCFDRFKAEVKQAVPPATCCHLTSGFGVQPWDAFGILPAIGQHCEHASTAATPLGSLRTFSQSSAMAPAHPTPASIEHVCMYAKVAT